MIRNRVEDFSAQKQIPRVGQEAMFLDQIHISLQKPIPERCEDVRRMKQEWNIKDSTRAADRGHDTIYTALFSEFLEYFLPTQSITLSAHSSGNRSQQEPKLTPRKYFNGVGDAVPPSYSGLIKSIDSRQTTAAGPSYEQYSIQAR
ncbi:uncharacterized protein LOC114543667 [Dendronephthya gigantea]|uniref:uncharacterized protein LOC114543667 n=1 Tax=Dendronephthya gigantea TaxID=151771 RepID=UPI00106C0222|nr:uncharacterized protein LOC114543667 [Dendronephthya gigantea]